MLDIVSLVIIFIKNSFSFDYTYSFITIPYLTYFISRKGIESFYKVMFIAFILSINSLSLSYYTIYLYVYYLIFYFVFKHIKFEKINLILILILQVGIVNIFHFMNSRVLSIEHLVKQVVLYFIFNLIYMSFSESSLRLESE